MQLAQYSTIPSTYTHSFESRASGCVLDNEDEAWRYGRTIGRSLLSDIPSRLCSTRLRFVFGRTIAVETCKSCIVCDYQAERI